MAAANTDAQTGAAGGGVQPRPTTVYPKKLCAFCGADESAYGGCLGRMQGPYYTSSKGHDPSSAVYVHHECGLWSPRVSTGRCAKVQPLAPAWPTVCHNQQQQTAPAPHHNTHENIRSPCLKVTMGNAPRLQRPPAWQITVDAWNRLQSVVREVRRARNLRCSRCDKPGAALGCRVPSCPRCFHLPCAIESGCW